MNFHGCSLAKCNSLSISGSSRFVSGPGLSPCRSRTCREAPALAAEGANGHRVPDELDKRVAKLKLESMGIKIDRLTPEQEEYLAGWSEGT